MVLCHLWTHRAGSPSPCPPKTMVSCLSGSSRLFQDSLLASCGTLTPFRLSSQSQPWSSPWGLTSKTQALAPSPHPSWLVSRQVSQTGECWSALILCVGIATFCPLHPCCCALTCGSESPHPLSPPVRGIPNVWKIFLLHSSFPEVRDLSLFLCLFFSFYFLLPYPGMWRLPCLFGSLRSSVSIQ